MKNIPGLAVLFIVALPLGIAIAQESDTTRRALVDSSNIDQLITGLQSDSAQVRESARKRIVKIGVSARKALRNAAVKSDDPKVRLAAWAGLKAIQSSQEVVTKDFGRVSRPGQRLWISPNGEHLGYILKKDGKEAIVYDDVKGPDFDELSSVPVFSRDSKRLGYQAVNGGVGFILIAGQEDKRKPTPQAGRAVYAPVGKGIAYGVRGDKDYWVVRDGKEGPHYANVTMGRFSPDGKRLYYIATDDKKGKFAILDGVAGRRYESVGMGVFSPDSKRLAYAAGRGGKMTVVCDGKEGKFRDETVHYPLFSPDGKGLAYWTRTRTKGRPKLSIVWNEKVVARITGEPQLVFSPDGKELACGTYQGDVYRCGKEAVMIASGHDAASQPVFSPDGKHIAYAAGKGMKWRIYVDGKALVGSYDATDVLHWSGPSGGGAQMILSDRPAFSACGRHIFFKGTRGKSHRNRKQFIVVNGVEGPEHDAVWIPDDFKKNPKCLRYVVRDGVQIHLVETPWPKPLVWSDAIEPAGGGDPT
jgi:hypothetical protein